MSTKIVENIYTLPKYLLKKDGTLLLENNNKKTQRRPKTNVNPNKTYEEGVEEVRQEKIDYTRNPQLRIDALAKYKYVCAVCGVDFENSIYGEYGTKCIEVHHILPISKGKRNSTVDDVRVVCSNCHSIIHRQGVEPVDVDELAAFVKAQNPKK